MESQGSFHEDLGPEALAGEAFAAYRERLVGLARQQFEKRLRERADPEGLVQSVFLTFFRRARDGELDLESWQHVWNLLAHITICRCRNHLDFLRSGRRDVAREVPLAGEPGVLAGETDPVEAVALVDLVGWLLSSFDSDQRPAVDLFLQGHASAAVAEQTGWSLRTVTRLREQVRRRLARELERLA